VLRGAAVNDVVGDREDVEDGPPVAVAASTRQSPSKKRTRSGATTMLTRTS
jgi:hypothetical protein